MNPFTLFGAEGDGNFQVLWEDGERVFCRDVSHAKAGRSAVLAVLPAAEHPAPATLDRLAHEYGLKDELDGAWAVRPLELVREGGRTMLVLEDPGGEPVDRLLGPPLEISQFLRIAIHVAGALRQMHERGLVHKDIKPANILLDAVSGGVWLTGFGIASRLPREHQAPTPPEVIAGTLAYMAPEQTGRMNRSVDSRSDLYALGVTFYEMLTGQLPFTAADPMEWVHCHIARQPVPPNEQVAAIPVPLSAIVMKLLAKTGEERYQTAAGVEADLRRCLAEWDSHGRIEPFSLGGCDVSDRLLIPENLYGREREIEALIEAFDRVVAQGTTEFVLVSGYAGIGKSSVVHELHKMLVPPRGLFASGKFDQYKRDIPHATLGQAFQSLVRSLLTQSEEELGLWRESFNDALGPNGQLMVNLVPELELVIGKQPPVADLPPQGVQSRFQMVFRRFLGVFARKEHPLTLFLDDLQWLDTATLHLLKHLVTHPEVRHLLLVGAYRDNEVGPAHPLVRMLATIADARGEIRELRLEPLTSDDVARLVADTLHADPDLVRTLAELMFAKTGGNPFFTIQFFTALVDEGLIAFDRDTLAWHWDLDRIRAKGITDNVADLMAGRFGRLPAAALQILKCLACLGNSAETSALGMVLGQAEEEIHAVLVEAVRSGLIFSLEGAYAFVHDRVREAAYALIPEDERAASHLHIGRVLASQTPSQQREEKIFEIVNQFDRATALIATVEERERVAELDLIAGRRARSSTAYASALTYLAAGCALLAKDSWERRHDLAFALAFHRAECEFLTGDLAAAEEGLLELWAHAESLVDKVSVTRLRLDLYTTLHRSDRAVEICLDYLRSVDINWSPHPTSNEVLLEYERMWRKLGTRSIEDLADLPPIEDPVCRATLDVLTSLQAPARFTDQNLPRLLAGRMANLSLDHGNSDATSLGYVWVGQLLTRFGEFEAGYRFGRLGLNLVDERGLDRFKARVYLVFGHSISPWNDQLRTSVEWLRRAFDTGEQTGDLTFAAYASNSLITLRLAAGDTLADVEREADSALASVRKSGFGLIADMMTGSLQLIRTLRGLTAEFGCFDDEEFNESRFEHHLEANPLSAIAACWYWIRKLQARFHAGEWTAAADAASKAEQLLWTSQSNFEEAEYHFYGALARAARDGATSAEDRPRHLQVLLAHHAQLARWAENCPENFRGRAALVGAEIARIEDRQLDAQRLYEDAIRSSRADGFVQDEGLAHEVAARFYAAHSFETIAHAYLRNARHCYLRWGAAGKVRQLEQLHPHLRDAPVPPSATSTMGALVDQLDVGTVLKAAQAVSGEIVLDRLIKTLLRIAVEHAGAGRGLLILFPGDEPRVAAEATTGRGQVEVMLRQTAASPAELPESMLHYVIRTRESVILDDALAQNPFPADEYICQKRARSVLCLPLVKQAELIGVLYLENKLASHVFTPARISVLEVLASQAAISLENARLYNDLREREARIRRLVDANIIGIMIGDARGHIIEANEAFLDLLGYGREDLVSGRIRWTKLTPGEWAAADQDAIAQLSATGTCKPYEKEYFRKDGSRVPVLVGGAFFEGKRDQGVVFVIDMTERKRAEEALRKSEERFRTLVQFSFDVYWESDAQHRFTGQEFAEGLADAPAAGSEIGKTRWEVPYLEPDAETWRKHRETLDAHLPFRDFELARPTADGGKRYVSVSGLPVFDKAGRFIGYRGVSRHITERKRAEEALRDMQMELAHANRVATMGQLSASTAHEVKQPIGATVINAQAALRWLGRQPPDLEEARQALAQIVQDGIRAGDILDGIRALIKKAPSRKEPLDINAAIREVIQLTRGETVKNGISVQTDLAGGGLPLVEGDRVQLQQVILNLIMNAVEAMSSVSGGARELFVSTRKAEPKGVLVRVRDSGPGLATEILDRLFEAFYTTKPGGLGMGLSICRSIIEAHGGRLWASANVPRGATFEFTLPAHPDITS